MRQAFVLISAILVSIYSLSFSNFAAANGGPFEIIPLNSGDESFFEKQRTELNDLARQNLGREFHGKRKNDIEVLQALLDKQIVKGDQTLLLQAMGIILGDLYVRDLGVRWVVFSDQMGRSRALQWTTSKHVLFPITMISRRVSAGVKVDVDELYEKGFSVLQRVIVDENRRQTLMIKSTY